MNYGSVIYELAEQLGEKLNACHMTCGVAESCTGGSLSATLTSIPGSSNWFDRGVITYSNNAKNQMLNVPQKTLKSYGAVSEQTARAMAEGVIAECFVDISVAITGIAGPDGGSEEKPVGMVWIAWAGAHQPTYSRCFQFLGNRPAVRHQAVEAAIEGLIDRCMVAPQKLQRNKDRYFFALIPDDSTASTLFKRSNDALKDVKCSKIPVSKLHMTLSYLGSVPPGFIQEAMQVATSVKAKPFKIELNQFKHWSKQKICVVEPEQPPEAIEQLVSDLNSDLVSVGFKPEKKSFKPHVTIARKCNKKRHTPFKKPVLWSVDAFHLVKAFQKSGETHYETVESWRL